MEDNTSEAHVDSTLMSWGPENTFNRHLTDQWPYAIDANDIILYSGSDYVLPEYRKRGINTELYFFALSQFKYTIKRLASRNTTTKVKLLLLYGLSALSDYDHVGQGSSRTPLIAKIFYEFLQAINIPIFALVSHRFQSMWPIFDMKTSKFIFVKNENAALMYENVLIAYKEIKVN